MYHQLIHVSSHPPRERKSAHASTHPFRSSGKSAAGCEPIGGFHSHSFFSFCCNTIYGSHVSHGSPPVAANQFALVGQQERAVGNRLSCVYYSTTCCL